MIDQDRADRLEYLRGLRASSERAGGGYGERIKEIEREIAALEKSDDN